MNRHEKRLQTLQAQLSEVEGLIENLQDKIRRNNFKKDRKRWRKKMAKDLYFRVLQNLLHEAERAVYASPALGAPYGISGLSEFLKNQEGTKTSRYNASR